MICEEKALTFNAQVVLATRALESGVPRSEVQTEHGGCVLEVAERLQREHFSATIQKLNIERLKIKRKWESKRWKCACGWMNVRRRSICLKCGDKRPAAQPSPSEVIEL
jgi:hypothetical protein